MITADHRGRVILEYLVEFQDGKINGFPRAQFEKEAAAVNGKFWIQFVKWTKKRTNPQNRVQWWYFTEIAKHTGHTPAKIKGICQAKFLARDVVDENTGEIYPCILDTSDLDTGEHNDFMEDVRNWAKNVFDLVLPLPRDVPDTDPNSYDELKNFL
jgi:hypothetical protein